MPSSPREPGTATTHSWNMKKIIKILTSRGYTKETFKNWDDDGARIVFQLEYSRTEVVVDLWMTWREFE